MKKNFYVMPQADNTIVVRKLEKMGYENPQSYNGTAKAYYGVGINGNINALGNPRSHDEVITWEELCELANPKKQESLWLF